MLIGCFFVFAVITFDFQSNVRNFIRQHWVQSPLGFARKISCEKGTADSLCTVPIIGYPYASQVSQVEYMICLSVKPGIRCLSF